MNILQIILIIVIGAAGAGFAYQTIGSLRDKHRFPPPGRLVDIGGRRLHLNIMGEANGSPTVILEAGMVSFSSNWAWVQPELAKQYGVTSVPTFVVYVCGKKTVRTQDISVVVSLTRFGCR